MGDQEMTPEELEQFEDEVVHNEHEDHQDRSGPARESAALRSRVPVSPVVPPNPD